MKSPTTTTNEIITIVTVSHNNYHYLKFMVEQLKKLLSGKPYQLVIMDNVSKDQKTLEYLHQLEIDPNPNTTIIYNSTNYGPRINPLNHQDLYWSLPERFLMTDPDILLNPEMPPDFYEIMCKIDRKSTRLNSSHTDIFRMPSSA